VSILGDVVDHQDFLQVRHEHRPEFLVRRMGQIDGPSFGVVEGHQEAVRETVGQALGAVVRAPLEAHNRGNLGGEFAKGVFDRLDLIGRRAFLVLEKDLDLLGICDYTCFYYIFFTNTFTLTVQFLHLLSSLQYLWGVPVQSFVQSVRKTERSNDDAILNRSHSQECRGQTSPMGGLFQVKGEKMPKAD